MPRQSGASVFCGLGVFVLLIAMAPEPVSAQTRNSKPLFASEVITTKTPGHAIEIDVDISSAKELYLVVTDGGDGYACDWADWASPRLVGPEGEKKLTELNWKSATTNWGQVRKNRNAEGGRLRINGRSVEFGIGAHANSVIAFELPEGYTRFKATAGLDNGGTNQNGGNTTSVKFLVYTEKPPASVTRASSSGGTGDLDPADALEALEVGDGLEATLFAAEPLLLSPSNIDIDHRGRVWVCEVVNYRRFRNPHAHREEGDRILILKDSDHDGKADKQAVFYQGRDIDSAHGICVLGNRVIVSAGDSVFILTDNNGDDKADQKEVLFTGISGVQHDHGIHAFVFGPDGKLYFNFGNEGKQIKDKDGNPIVDKAGNVVNDRLNPYQQGMVFRCNLDGTEFETLGWNFRNNWEVAVDSFGTLWQSDNDDDGNRGVRINYVMEFGNYGYRDEFTGAGWRTPRTGMNEEIPKRHWHLNDPGVVPNLLQTGAGSPTGICVYEGDLLPERFRGQIIHCDAGPNIVRAYLIENDGAGYKAEIANILEGVRDKWFRPSDVCVAPDGSLIIADWYDPGVGGHRMVDINKGRLFRVVPDGHKGYKQPEYDFSSVTGAIEALNSPNLAARYLAWEALHRMGTKAERELNAVFESDANPRIRARALWLLGKMERRGPHYVDKAIQDGDPNIRIVGLRLARQILPDVLPVVRELVRDRSPQVRRECAIALRHLDSSYPEQLWAILAAQHQAGDRWYLEALGIGADKHWDASLIAWLNRMSGEFNTPAGREIIWRSRSRLTPKRLLAKLILNPNTPHDELPRYFRALDLLQGPEVEEAILEIALADVEGDADRKNLIAREAFARLKRANFENVPRAKAKLNDVLENSQGTEQFIRLVDQFSLRERYPALLEMAREKSDEQLGVEAIRVLLAKYETKLISDGLADEDPQRAERVAAALGHSADGKAVALLLPLIDNDDAPLAVRRQAVRGLSRFRGGAHRLVRLARSDRLDPDLKSAVAAALHTAQWDDVRQSAAELFPLPVTKNNKPLPPINELLERKGDANQGRVLYNTTGTCAKCHKINGIGKDVGPDLTEIGSKLSRQAMFESIIYPSAGVSHNYETYVVVLEDGNTVTGLMTSQTPDEITLKDADSISRTFKKSEVVEIVKQKISLMPADLNKVLTADDLVDIVDYMMTLKKKPGS